MFGLGRSTRTGGQISQTRVGSEGLSRASRRNNRQLPVVWRREPETVLTGGIPRYPSNVFYGGCGRLVCGKA